MRSIVFVTCVIAAGAALSGDRRQGQRAQSTPLIIESMVGRDLFGFYCASCHGSDGLGHGPVAASLKTVPSDLTRITARAGGTFPAQRVKDTVAGTGDALTPSHGPKDMPVWGPIFRFLDPSDVRTAFRIEQLVKYVESIQARD